MSTKSYTVWMGDPEAGNGGSNPESWSGHIEIAMALTRVMGSRMHATDFLQSAAASFETVQLFGSDWLQVGVPGTDLVIEFKEDE